MANECDVFISRTSTALQSFILLGRLSISYLNAYPVDICERIDYLKSDATIKCESKKELRKIVNETFKNYSDLLERFEMSRNEYINNCIGRFVGKSSERIAKLVQENID